MGHGVRAMARIAQVDRKTVRRYAAAARVVGLSPSTVRTHSPTRSLVPSSNSCGRADVPAAIFGMDSSEERTSWTALSGYGGCDIGTWTPSWGHHPQRPRCPRNRGSSMPDYSDSLGGDGRSSASSRDKALCTSQATSWRPCGRLSSDEELPEMLHDPNRPPLNVREGRRAGCQRPLNKCGSPPRLSTQTAKWDRPPSSGAPGSWKRILQSLSVSPTEIS
jgi:hypothetical protein